MNNRKRLMYSILMYVFTSGVKRTKFLKKHNIFGSIGKNVMMQSRSLPLNPECVFIGDNVRCASGVIFITHDVAHHTLNNMNLNMHFSEKIGEIHIGDNVFIGANSIIMYDVTIGSNVIIGAGSVVVNDIPSDTVCVGVPCKPVKDFHSFVEKRKDAVIDNM